MLISRWVISPGWEIIPYMRSKCFIQRCKTVILWNGSAFTFPTQFLRCNSRGNLLLHLNYYVSWTIMSELPYTLKSPNKQLMHTFLHFVVSLQSRFYTSLRADYIMTLYVKLEYDKLEYDKINFFSTMFFRYQDSVKLQTICAEHFSIVHHASSCRIYYR